MSFRPQGEIFNIHCSGRFSRFLPPVEMTHDPAEGFTGIRGKEFPAT